MRKILARVLFSIAATVILAPLSAFAQDPGTAGPLAVTVQQYDYGDTAFMPPGFPGPVELRAEVYRPTNLATGPFPLVVFLHGRHAVCSASFTWPCPAGQTAIPSYQGYAYIGNRLASWGYIVVSISANGINAVDNSVFDLGALARAQLIQRHLDQWNTFNTTGAAPFGTTFVGRVDMQNVGTMGHSRGGEGVMRHFLLNQSAGSPYGIKAIFPLAPVDFNRPVINGVPFEVLLPYCDGDVSDLQGVHFYDDARYSMPGDLTRKHTVYFMGANHNYANTVWTSGFPGAGDDWGFSTDGHCSQTDPTRWSASKQQSATRTYMMGFFRRYIGEETQFDAMLKMDVPPPASSSLSASEAFAAYHAPDSAAERRDVNRYLTAAALTSNQLGGAVTASGFTPNDVCGGAGEPTPCNPTEPNSRQPHTTPSARSSAPGMSQLRGGYSAMTATYTNAIPAGFRDVSAFQMLQFRVSTNYADVRNTPGVAQDFVVRLTDGTGAFADVLTSTFSGVLFYPPGNPAAGEPVPKVLLNTARLSLSAFGGINLSDVRSIQFRFNQRASGAFLITDIAFADSGVPPSFPDLIETAVSNPPATVLQGGSFSVTDTVQNQGSVGAGASTTRYYLSLDTAKSGGDVLLTGTRSVPALAPLATSTGTVTVTVPGATAANTYFLLACADDTGLVAESNEGNNCIASSTTVQVQSGGGGGPDLVETAVSNPPSSVVLGGTFSVTDTVMNQGGSVAASSKTRYYFSTDAVKSSGDFILKGARSVPSLAAGASSTGSKTVTVKAGTPGGTYFLLACADDTHLVVEDNEGNNCKASTTTVVVTGPDLVETALTNPPATATAGSSFSVTDTVTNQGSAAAGSTLTRYFLSLNATKGGTDILLSGSRVVPGLAAGGTSSGTVTVTIPGGTPANAYFLLACSDDSKAVTELNENNNCRASATKVTVQ
jgi:hypothetical protein